jgi:hypothetical protein
MWNIGPIQTQAILYIHAIYTEYVSKSGRGHQGRSKRTITNDNEVHHLCVGIRHEETYRKLLNDTSWGKGREVQ